MNHPVKNIFVNVTVMSQSATCGQELALNETKELIRAATAPLEGKLYFSYTVSNGVKPFPRRQILDSSKLEEVADDNFNFYINGRKLSEWVENSVGKG